MTTCEAIQTAITRYAGKPRSELPAWLRYPKNEDQFDLAVAVYGAEKGVKPVCENGLLVAWAGPGACNEC